MGCISGHKCKEGMGNVTNDQLTQALEYFNLPEFMWPIGLYIRHSQTVKYDKVANRLMDAIKADMKQLVANDTDCASVFTQTYYMYLKEGSLCLDACTYNQYPREITQALKNRLTVLAAAECLQVIFGNGSRESYYDRVRISIRIP